MVAPDVGRRPLKLTTSNRGLSDRHRCPAHLRRKKVEARNARPRQRVVPTSPPTHNLRRMCTLVGRDIDRYVCQGLAPMVNADKPTDADLAPKPSANSTEQLAIADRMIAERGGPVCAEWRGVKTEPLPVGAGADGELQAVVWGLGE